MRKTHDKMPDKSKTWGSGIIPKETWEGKGLKGAYKIGKETVNVEPLPH